MPERARSLHATLVELQEQLDDAGSIDGGLRAELRRAADEIERRLDKGDSSLEPPLLDQVRALMLRFEGEHPALAEAVERVVDSLSRLGI